MCASWPHPLSLQRLRPALGRGAGLGREGSRWGLDEYLEQKYIMLGLGAPLP